MTNPTSKTVLQRYQLGKLLSKESSYANIFHARSLITNKSVAIKVINKAEIYTSMRPQIVREVAAMHRLDHPNILKIHEVLATKSKIYLVMELTYGYDLIIKVEHIARRYFHQLVSAIHYCHQKGVVHQDIKPQNLLLDAYGNIKVGGFEHCLVADDVTYNMLIKPSISIVHTPFAGVKVLGLTTPTFFTAPEVAGKDAYDGVKADVWSCGVILFVLLTGYLPFDDLDSKTLLKKMSMKEFYFPSWVTKPAKRLVTRLLDPNPKTRITMDDVVCDAWFRNVGLSYHRGLGPFSLDYVPSLEKRMRDKFKFERNNNKDINAIMRTTADSTANSSASMNAFEIIMMSSGFYLEGLCGKGKVRRPKRFTMSDSKEVVLEKVVEIGINLGYEVQKSENCRGTSSFVWLGKGRFIVLLTISEVVVELIVVEMKVMDGAGVGWNQEKAYWNELMNGLSDLRMFTEERRSMPNRHGKGR